MSKLKPIPEFESLNELAHPSHLHLRSPKQQYLSRFNELYRSYQRLEHYMHDSDRPQSEIDTAKEKADELFNHLRGIHQND